jgi:hypothetical protein
MVASTWTEADSTRARAIWAAFQQQNDLSDRSGQTAGIDPVAGQVWLGDSIQDVVSQRDAAGSAAPLFFIRVGSSTYYRKGGRR